MSKITLSPSPTGSAVYTIASPAGSTDRTLNLPDSAGTVATAESTLAQFNVTGSAPVFACRAWVNFNGTGTVAIRASGNVSSITDNGTGDYTVNFTTAMPDANYSAVGIASTEDNFPDFPNMNPLMIRGGSGDMATNSVRIKVGQANTGGFAFADRSFINVAIFR